MNLHRRAGWLVPAGLLALRIVLAIGGALRLAELGSGTDIAPENARFFAAPTPVVIHILNAVLFSAPSAFLPKAGGGRCRAPPRHGNLSRSRHE